VADRRLPPLLIQAGTGDPFKRESQALADRAREHGVNARLELYPVATHSFCIFWSFLPEASAALERAGAFTGRLVSPADRSAAGR
jgi:monoterpene epsilon-lactone hydrolase